MEITTLSHIRWKKSLTSNPAEQFGKNSAARIRSTLSKITETNVSWTFSELDAAALEWFLPLYEQQIGQKNNPNVFDVRGRTLDSGKKYSLLTLYEAGIPVGGTIFRINENNVCMVAFRIYQNQWESAKLQAKPSLLTEYLLCEFIQKQGIYTLSHGKDRCPYGEYASIGLAIFKLSIGCSLYKPDNYETQKIELSNINKDMLILELPNTETSEVIKGYLVTTKETESKWLQVTKYPHLLEVKIIYRES